MELEKIVQSVSQISRTQAHLKKDEFTNAFLRTGAIQPHLYACSRAIARLLQTASCVHGIGERFSKATEI